MKKRKQTSKARSPYHYNNYKTVWDSIRNNVTKTVKKLFTEDKLPLKVRDNLAILSDEEDNVIWLEDYGVNRKFAVSEKTENIAVITQR